MSYVIHPREEWIGTTPWDHTINGRGQYYICPLFKGWVNIADVVIHYPGADFSDMDFNDDGFVDLYDTKKILQQMHHSYLMGSRGYSLGYGFAVGQVGDIFEVRGWRNTNAANAGDKAHGTVGWNNWSISIQIVVDEENPANPAQVAAVNWLLAELERIKGDTLNLKWHGMGQSTSCAGSGIITQIKNGTIKAAAPPQPQPQPPHPGDTDMASSVLIVEDANDPFACYRCDGASKTWIKDGHMMDQVWMRINESQNGTKVAVDGFIYTYMRNGNLDFIASCGPIVGPIPQGHDEYGRH